MEHKPTKEQERIYHFVKNRPENLLIEARAGAGKTTVLLEILKLLPADKSITFLAFNKHIAEELKDRIPAHVRCYTSHGLGLSGIKRKYGNNIVFDEFKADHIINKKAKGWKLSEELNEDFELMPYLSNMKKMINLCKLTLTTDPNYFGYIADRYDLKYNEKTDKKRILSVMEYMMNDKETYDFTDMVFLPAIDKNIWLFPQDYVLVDECLPQKTYVSTSTGKHKIKFLYEKFKKFQPLPTVDTYNETTNEFEHKRIKRIWSNGISDVFSVSLGGKRKLYSTQNHKFLTLDGWKRLDELKIGDAVLSNYNSQPYHSLLNEEQKEIFIGSILGDGSLHRMSKNICRLKIIHGKPQKEYVEWKSNFFDCELELVEKNGYSKKNAYRFLTLGYYFNMNIDDVIKSITPKSLAIAWMDDGSLTTAENGSTLFSLAPNREHVKLLSEVILKKWNIESNVRVSKSSTTKKEYYYLGFNKDNTEKISELISPYIHESMKYKILLKHRNNVNNENWGKEDKSKLGCIVVSEEYKFHKSEEVFDMEVEDNHNFIITSGSVGKSKSIAGGFGIITHNCQDMNFAQQRIVEKMLKKDKLSGKITGRLIAVGDFFQSIYGFTGVHEKTFEWFRSFPNMKALPLDTTFRCAKNIVIEANRLVPDIKALDSAPDGVVREGSILDEAESGDFVLCRTTMPLVKLFFHFLLQKKKAVIKGSDIGLSLIEMIGTNRTIEALTEHWEKEMADFRTDMRKKGILNFDEHSGYVAMSDKANTLIFLCRIASSIPDLKQKIGEIFTDELVGIVLSTVHKSKGLEANRVFIARPDLLPMRAKKAWQVAQERNLTYVAYTRAKMELIFDRTWTDEK